MNPALPALLGLTLAALLARRAGVHRVVLASGLAAICLLSASLLVPQGVPSPAADIARLPPWSAAGAVAGGNPAMQDVTFQIFPWLLHLRHEVRDGRWPFWNPHQFSGMTFWGNGQSAPLSPFHLLFVALPLQIGFFVLPWLRIVTGAVGVFVLARELGLGERSATVAAVTYPLSGMLVSFLLFPMANALALVPWVFWAVERIANGRGTAAALALVTAVQLLGGHPETALHTALLSALYLAVRRPWRGASAAWARFTAGWAAGGAVAAVVLLPLVATVFESARWQQAAELRGAEPALSTLAALPLRLVLPDLYGNPALGTWWGPFNYLATAVYAGALALPLAASGLAGWREDRRRLGWGVVLVFAAAAAWHAPGLTQLLEALPLVGDALHHRLLFGVELALSLLAGWGVERWLGGGGRRAAAWGLAVAAALLAAAMLLYAHAWTERGLWTSQLRWAGWLAALWLLAGLGSGLSPVWRGRAATLLAAVVALDLVAAHRSLHPVQRLPELYPPTGAVDFLRHQSGRMAGVGAVLRPNAAMVYGLDDVRGDDSLKPRAYEDVLSQLGGHHPAYFTSVERWDSPWLDRLGVRWVMAPANSAPPMASWRLAYEGPDARVFERPGAPPLVRWADGSPSPAVVEKRPGSWRIAIPAGRGGELVVAEGWDAGWSARLDGERVVLRRVEAHLLGLRIAPGPAARELRLRYRPRGFDLGAWISAAGLAALLVSWRRGW